MLRGSLQASVCPRLSGQRHAAVVYLVDPEVPDPRQLLSSAVQVDTCFQRQEQLGDGRALSVLFVFQNPSVRQEWGWLRRVLPSAPPGTLNARHTS